MNAYYRVTIIILVSIVAIGLVAIPFGNPKLVWKGYSKALYPCIPLALLVIVGNSLAPPHVHLMMTFSKPVNAIVLIVGGYVLQIALIYTSLRSILNISSKRLTATP